MAGGIRKTPAGTWRAYWQESSGRQASKTFSTKRDDSVPRPGIGSRQHYVSRHAGRVLFGDHARSGRRCRIGAEVFVAE
ncbi:hypothetical protein GCM10009609_37560 [Pseudonocardia aurantiaca]